MPRRKRQRNRYRRKWFRKIQPEYTIYPSKREIRHIQRIQYYYQLVVLTHNGMTQGVKLPAVYLPRKVILNAKPGGRKTKTVWGTRYSRRR